MFSFRVQLSPASIMLEISDYAGVTWILRFWKWYLCYSILETTITQSVFSGLFLFVSLFVVPGQNYMTYGFETRTQINVLCPDFLHNLDTDIYTSWLSSSICKTGIKNIDFTNRAMVQISYPSFADCFQKSLGCKNHSNKWHTYSAHLSKHHPFPHKSLIPCSHILDSLRWENGLMVDIIRHPFWSNLMKRKAKCKLINKTKLA